MKNDRIAFKSVEDIAYRILDEAEDGEVVELRVHPILVQPLTAKLRRRDPIKARLILVIPDFREKVGKHLVDNDWGILN